MCIHLERRHHRRDETSEKSSQIQTDFQHRTQMSTTLSSSGASRNIAKPLLWAALGLAGISVLIFTDLPLLYQPSAYRTKLIKDVVLLVPHVITGVLATILGPFLFSTRFRQQHLKRHRIMGRVYVISIAISAPTALILQHDGRPRPNRTQHTLHAANCSTCCSEHSRPKVKLRLYQHGHSPGRVRLPCDLQDSANRMRSPLGLRSSA